MREELTVKLVTFLTTEFKREGMRQCTRLDLLHAPGNSFRDEEMQSWMRTDEPEFFESLALTEKLVATIIEKAENHVDTLPPGKHRYILRVHTLAGGRQNESFVMLPAHNGVPDDNAIVLAGGTVGPKGEREALVSAFNVAMRSNTQMFDGGFRTLNNQLQDAIKERVEQRLRIRELERENDELRNTRDDRQWQRHKEDRGAQRSEKMFSELFAFGKLALTKALGGSDGKSAAPDRLIILLRELKDTINQGHMMALAKELSQSQVQMFIEIMMIVESMEVPATPPPGQPQNGAQQQNGAPP